MKDKYFIIILLISIILLTGVTMRNFKDWRASMEEINLQNFNIEIPDLSLSSQQGEITEKEYSTKDGKLKLSYSSDWLETNNLAMFNNEISKEGAEILFFAQKFNLEDSSLSFLTVQQISFEGDLNEAIDWLELETENKGIEVKIIKKDVNEEEAVLDLNYKQNNSVFLRLKEKLIKDAQTIYLIDIAAPEKDWGEIEQEAENIINSVNYQK